MKAVIVDLKGKYAAALDESGAVVKIPNANYTIGQRIQLHELPRRHTSSLKRIAAAALAASLILSIGMGTAYALPYGTVSLDADAEIEYTINRFDRVLSVKALNEEGEAILSEIDPDRLRFCSVEQAISVTLEAPNFSSDNTPPARITATTKNELHSERLQERLTERFPERNPPADVMPELSEFRAGGNLPHEEDTMQDMNRDNEQRQEQFPLERQELPGSESIPESEEMSPPDAGHEGSQEPAFGMPGPAVEYPRQNIGMPAPSQAENGSASMPPQGAFGMSGAGGPPPGK